MYTCVSSLENSPRKQSTQTKDGRLFNLKTYFLHASR